MKASKNNRVKPESTICSSATSVPVCEHSLATPSKATTPLFQRALAAMRLRLSGSSRVEEPVEAFVSNDASACSSPTKHLVLQRQHNSLPLDRTQPQQAPALRRAISAQSNGAPVSPAAKKVVFGAATVAAGAVQKAAAAAAAAAAAQTAAAPSSPTAAVPLRGILTNAGEASPAVAHTSSQQQHQQQHQHQHQQQQGPGTGGSGLLAALQSFSAVAGDTVEALRDVREQHEELLQQQRESFQRMLVGMRQRRAAAAAGAAAAAAPPKAASEASVPGPIITVASSTSPATPAAARAAPAAPQAPPAPAPAPAALTRSPPPPPAALRLSIASPAGAAPPVAPAAGCHAAAAAALRSSASSALTSPTASSASCTPGGASAASASAASTAATTPCASSSSSAAAAAGAALSMRPSLPPPTDPHSITESYRGVLVTMPIGCRMEGAGDRLVVEGPRVYVELVFRDSGSGSGFDGRGSGGSIQNQQQQPHQQHPVLLTSNCVATVKRVDGRSVVTVLPPLLPRSKSTCVA